MVHLKRKEFADALQFCDRAIYLDASCVKARSRRAGCLQALGRLDDAITEAKQALASAEANEEFAANNATNSDAKAAAKKAALEAEKARLAAMQGEGLYKIKPKIPSAMIEQTKTSAEAAAAAAAETKVVRKQLDELQAEREDRDVEEAVAQDAQKRKSKDMAAVKRLMKQKDAISSRVTKEESERAGETSTFSAARDFKKVTIEMDEDEDEDEEPSSSPASASVSPPPPPPSTSSSLPKSANGLEGLMRGLGSGDPAAKAGDDMSELMASMEKMMKGAPGGLEGMQKMMREVMEGKGDPSAAATDLLAKAMPSVDDLPSQYALVDDFLDAIVQHEASASASPSIPTTKTGVPALEALALVLA